MQSDLTATRFLILYDRVKSTYQQTIKRMRKLIRNFTVSINRNALSSAAHHNHVLRDSIGKHVDVMGSLLWQEKYLRTSGSGICSFFLSHFLISFVSIEKCITGVLTLKLIVSHLDSRVSTERVAKSSIESSPNCKYSDYYYNRHNHLVSEEYADKYTIESCCPIVVM